MIQTVRLMFAVLLITACATAQGAKAKEATAKPMAGKDWTVPDVGMEFIWIPAMKCWVGK